MREDKISVTMTMAEYERMMGIIKSKVVYVQEGYGGYVDYIPVGTHQEYIDGLQDRIAALEVAYDHIKRERDRIRDFSIGEFKMYKKERKDEKTVN